MEPKPHILALVLCDYVAAGMNGKFTLVGTCSKLLSNKFPAAFGSLGVFVSANSVPQQGVLNFFLRHEDGNTTVPLPGIKIERAPEDRREIFQAGGLFHGLVIPKPGMWDLVAVWNGSQLATHPVWVLQLEGGVS